MTAIAGLYLNPTPVLGKQQDCSQAQATIPSICIAICSENPSEYRRSDQIYFYLLNSINAGVDAMATGGLYTVELDQDRAKTLARDGGALLLLGVPEGTVVGIDHQVRMSAHPSIRNRFLRMYPGAAWPLYDTFQYKFNGNSRHRPLVTMPNLVRERQKTGSACSE